MLLEEAEQVSEFDPELAAALLSFAANLPVFRLEGFAAVELTERAWRLGDPTRPRTPAERSAYALAKTMAGDVSRPGAPRRARTGSREGRRDRPPDGCRGRVAARLDRGVRRRPHSPHVGGGRAAVGRLAAAPAAVADRAGRARLPGRPLGPGSRRGLRGDRIVRRDGPADRARVCAGDDRSHGGSAGAGRGLPPPGAGGLRRRCSVRTPARERAGRRGARPAGARARRTRSRDRGARAGGANRARGEARRAMARPVGAGPGRGVQPHWAHRSRRRGPRGASSVRRRPRAASPRWRPPHAAVACSPPDDAFEASFRCRSGSARAGTDAVRARPDRARLRRAASAGAEADEGARAAADGASDVRAARRGAVGGARPQRAARFGPVGADARAAGGRRAHAAGAAGRRARRRRRDEPRGRGGSVPQREDDRVPPRARLPQARHPLQDRARTRRRARLSRRTTAARGGHAGSAAAR